MVHQKVESSVVFLTGLYIYIYTAEISAEDLAVLVSETLYIYIYTAEISAEDLPKTYIYIYIYIYTAEISAEDCHTRLLGA